MTDVTPLVSADWLAQRLGARDLLLIDIRSAVDGGGKDAYLQAHVPGAVHTDYAKDGWRATKGMATGLLPEPDFLAKLFGSLGLTPDVHAIIISAGTSAGDFSAAARVYWTLKVSGHDRVSILEGGMASWVGQPVEAGPRPPVAADKYPVRLRKDIRCDLSEAEAALGHADVVMLDSRSESYFAGREKSPQAKRAGRIPASRHLDHVRVFDPATKRLKPASELAALFGDVPPKPVVNYCNTGHQAATNWFVLSEILHRPSQLYDGSMSEWTEDDGRPVEVG
ncbi:MAG: sulfurtransferase [Xanthobacteraceae bacterium]